MEENDRSKKDRIVLTSYLPVLARTMRSRPDEIAKGRHLDCTSVGRMCPNLETAFLSRISSPVASAKAAKVSSGSSNEPIFFTLGVFLAYPMLSILKCWTFFQSIPFYKIMYHCHLSCLFILAVPFLVLLVSSLFVGFGCWCASGARSQYFQP